MSFLQDYSQSIICNDKLMNYLTLAKSVFDPQWWFLVFLRSIDPKNETEELMAYKERQIFCRIMALQCVCNVCDLSYWVLIQTTVYYAHSLRATVVKLSFFDGKPLETSICDERFTSLVKGLARVRRRVLSCHLFANYVYNNVTSSGQLRDSRGKSIKFLHGTHMMMHAVHPCEKTDYDHLRVENTFDRRQTMISSDVMRGV